MELSAGSHAKARQAVRERSARDALVFMVDDSEGSMPAAEVAVSGVARTPQNGRAILPFSITENVDAKATALGVFGAYVPVLGTQSLLVPTFPSILTFVAMVVNLAWQRGMGQSHSLTARGEQACVHLHGHAQ